MIRFHLKKNHIIMKNVCTCTQTRAHPSNAVIVLLGMNSSVYANCTHTQYHMHTIKATFIAARGEGGARHSEKKTINV